VFNAVRLWDVAGLRCIIRYVGHNYPVHCVDSWYDVEHFLVCNGTKLLVDVRAQGAKSAGNPKIRHKEIVDRDLISLII